MALLGNCKLGTSKLGPATGSSSGASRSHASGRASGSARRKEHPYVFKHSNYRNPAFSPQKITKSSNSDGDNQSPFAEHILIQPAEDEDDQDGGYSRQHIAYVRYLRNHRLINDIFSSIIVPDGRSVVLTQRMHVLKRQVSSLTMHQTKLEAELQQMEDTFAAKKLRIVKSKEAFQDEIKRHCKPAVDEETFQKMVHRIYEDIHRNHLHINEPNFTVAAATVQTQKIKAPTIHGDSVAISDGSAAASPNISILPSQQLAHYQPLSDVPATAYA